MTNHADPDLRRLPRDAAHPVELVPGADQRAAIAAALELSALRKLQLTGRLIPEGRRDWRFEGHLGATVVQPCVATLAPVTTRIETGIDRHYAADFRTPDTEEAEMPEDDSIDPLPDRLDLIALAQEALSLALPLYPRAEGAAPAARIFGPPGVAPMDDEAAKPLAGLAVLRDRLAGGEDGPETPPEKGDRDAED